MTQAFNLSQLANKVNSSGQLDGSTGLTGTITSTGLSITNDASISGLTVGKGGSAIVANTAFGASALNSNTTGGHNNAFGASALYANTTGNYNTALGWTALNANTTGSSNVAIGEQALVFNTTASNNTAVGYQAGYSNTAASNSFVGYQAGYTNTTGTTNNVLGAAAMYFNTTGSANIVMGHTALYYNTTGSNNSALGYQALFSNTTASSNTAVGYQAGYTATTGDANTFIGLQAGYSKTTSASNTFIGAGAGYLVTTGASNTVLGRYNGNTGGLDIRTASNYIVLSDGDGNPRQFTNSSGFTKISNTGGTGVLNIAGTYHEIASDTNSNTLISVNSNASYGGVCLQSDVARNTTNGSFQAFGYFNRGAGAYRMYVQDSGNLQNTNNSYGAISDVKLKENIVDATPKLENLCKVKIRNYNLKDDQTHKQIGVIAQELEEVFPALVEEFNDKDGNGNDLGTTTKAVKYSVFVPILIKAIQELNAKVTALETQLQGK